MTRVEGSAQRGPVEKTGTLTTIATITNTPPARMTQGMSPSSHSPLDPSKGERPTRERAELFAGLLGFFFLTVFFHVFDAVWDSSFLQSFLSGLDFLSRFKCDQCRTLPWGGCSPWLDHSRPTHTHKAACRPSVCWFAHSPAPAHLPTPHVVSRVSMDRRHLSMCLVQFLLLLASPLLSSLPCCPALLRDMEGPCTSSRICWGQRSSLPPPLAPATTTLGFRPSVALLVHLLPLDPPGESGAEGLAKPCSKNQLRVMEWLSLPH